MENKRAKWLTKSKFVHGLNCPKYLWLEFNAPERLPLIDEGTQHRFDEGHLIGDFAKKLFPDGVDIPAEDFIKNLQETKKLIAQRQTLFEAALFYEKKNCYARADILVPAEGGRWTIIEVKSSTSVKEEYLHDVAFQRYCYEGAGLKIHSCMLMHINNQYVRKGEVDPKKLFVVQDITEEVNNLMDVIEERVDGCWDIIKSKVCPEIKIGKYCDDPYGCHGEDVFIKEHPEMDIFDLYSGKDTALELFNAGILEIKHIPDPSILSPKQMIQYRCAMSGSPYVQKHELKEFLEKLHYPLYFVDFETYNSAIPLFEGIKPYQQIPFQFSLHVIEHEGARPRHVSYLAKGSDDPRKGFLAQLKASLGSKGTILTYNQSFEQRILREVIQLFPQEKIWLSALLPRMEDLLAPFRSFYFYTSTQHGSNSIKKVLPALTNKSYQGLEIAQGEMASVNYRHLAHGLPDGTFLTPLQAKKIREDLEKYCALDTEGMVLIVDALRKIVH